MSLKMTDKNRPSISDMRVLFEEAIRKTPAFSKYYPLAAVEINGALDGYKNRDTDNLWLGFATGLRCAQRISDCSTSVEQAAKSRRAT